jgi:hypothetical protein
VKHTEQRGIWVPTPLRYLGAPKLGQERKTGLGLGLSLPDDSVKTCYRDSFTFLYVDAVRASQETHLRAYTSCYGDSLTCSCDALKVFIFNYNGYRVLPTPIKVRVIIL